MTVVEAQIDIAAPVDRVFEVVTDPRRGPEWNPNIIEMGPVQGIPIGAGSTWSQTVVLAGRPMVVQCRIADYRPPYEGLLQVSGGQQARIITRCEPVPGGTRVIQIVDFVPPGGMLGSMMAGAIKPMVQRELLATLSRQKATLETEAGGEHGPRT